MAHGMSERAPENRKEAALILLVHAVVFVVFLPFYVGARIKARVWG